MKKFVTLLMKETCPGMNGKMVTPTSFELYTAYIKKLQQFFPILYSLYIHCSVASYKYFKKLIKEV